MLRYRQSSLDAEEAESPGWTQLGLKRSGIKHDQRCSGVLMMQYFTTVCEHCAVLTLLYCTHCCTVLTLQYSNNTAVLFTGRWVSAHGGLAAAFE